MPIHILSDDVASQIAAGEVVERPASVVKELIENGLDAGAEHITINVEGAGKRLIEVADDGSGIPANELPLSVARHATSKLLSAEDLFRIVTLGFRGEALASIGSVSRLTITSRPSQAQEGMRLRVEGGNIDAPTPVGAPAGTVVRVEDLFWNVPARLKFLKTDRTERRQIDSLVTKYALAYPGVRVQLHQEGRLTIQTSGNGDRREVLAKHHGVDIARQMIEVIAKFEELSITGFITPPAVTRSNRIGIIFFVNGRPVQDVSLTTALTRAYHTLLMVGRFPMAVIFIDMPPEEVDVNVHPTKAEVRFRDRDRVFRGVGRAVRNALLAHTPVPGLDASLELVRWPTFIQGEGARLGVDPAWETTRGSERDLGKTQPLTGVSSEQTTLPDVRVPLLRLVGQVATAYIVAEGPDGLYLIDQHAAHERILYERFMAQREDIVPSQALLEPKVVNLPSSEAHLLEEQLPILQRIGFRVEPFGPGAFIIRAIPTILEKMEPSAALRVLVEDFEEDEAPLEHEIEAKVIARVCKRAAVKAGQVLSPDEQKALLIDLEACQAPRTCPHGRPTMIHLSVALLERQFGRKGAR
jgi:DNA mismatch repair protein MutL